MNTANILYIIKLNYSSLHILIFVLVVILVFGANKVTKISLNVVKTSFGSS